MCAGRLRGGYKTNREITFGISSRSIGGRLGDTPIKNRQVWSDLKNCPMGFLKGAHRLLSGVWGRQKRSQIRQIENRHQKYRGIAWGCSGGYVRLAGGSGNHRKPSKIYFWTSGNF